jgi:putative FmdB family regulatory protein
MPIYEYQCQRCGHHHEALQKISDPQLRKCPECGRSSLKRLVSAVRFRLAGSGWYETDFKSDKESKRNLHETGDKEATKPETKPEPVAGAKPDGKEGGKPEAKTDGGAVTAPDAKEGRRAMVTKPALAPARPKSNGKTPPARREPAERRRRR